MIQKYARKKIDSDFAQTLSAQSNMDALFAAIVIECKCVEEFLIKKYVPESVINKEITKEVNKGNKKQFTLPFCGMKRAGCEAICLNYGLYTQCEKPINDDGVLCIACNKVYEKKGHTQYGFIDDRIYAGDNFRDTKGKKVVPYGNVMEKLGLTIEEVKIEAAKIGQEINEEDFIVKKATRGRPKKEKEVKENKPRGRPKKDKEVVSNLGDDIIRDLCKEEIDNDSFKKSEKDSDSGSEYEVVKIEYEGEVYYKGEDNVVYKNLEGDEIGVWDEAENKILMN
jgi:hypothetical protein